MHVYEMGHPEIDLNLAFRDYLRTHDEAREKYARLKWHLITLPTSHQKNGALFTGYNLGKDQFIKTILQKAGFQGLCLRFCTHHDEWVAAKRFGQSQIGNLEHHVHFVFYHGTNIMGYAHAEISKGLDLFAIDEPEYKEHFLALCTRWLNTYRSQICLYCPRWA